MWSSLLCDYQCGNHLGGLSQHTAGHLESWWDGVFHRTLFSSAQRKAELRTHTREIQDEAVCSRRDPDVINKDGWSPMPITHQSPGWVTNTHQPLYSEREEGTEGKDHPQHRTGNESQPEDPWFSLGDGFTLLRGGLQNNTDLITKVLCYLLAKS